MMVEKFKCFSCGNIEIITCELLENMRTKEISCKTCKGFINLETDMILEKSFMDELRSI